METIAVACVLAYAVGAALFRVATKKVQQDPFWQSRPGLLVFLHQGLCAAALGLVVLATGGPQVQTGFWVAALVSGFLNIGIRFAQTQARALEDVSLVTPIDSTTPAAVVLVSMFINGEVPSLLGWVGIMVLALGTYVLNIQEFRLAFTAKAATGAPPSPLWRIYLAPFLAFGKSRGIRWAFVAVALATVSINTDGRTARLGNIAFGLAVILAITAVGNLAIALRRAEHRGFSAWRSAAWIAPIGLLQGVADYVNAWAYRHAQVAYVGALKRLLIPLTIILAALLLGERAHVRARLAGGIIMVAGATLIVLYG